MQDVTGVVSVAKEDSPTSVGSLGHAVDLASCRGGEHVAAGGARCQARTDKPRECRVVAGAATNHQCHLAGGHLGGAHDAAVHPGYIATVCCDEAIQRFIGEVCRVVENLRHFAAPAKAAAGCCRPWATWLLPSA
ncbi:hypothetical protein PJL15_04477 [Paenarthrobacter nitroguajacolicus]|nr:hypothetical protein [Paenarthrobacter nitroguajacolicus]